MARRRGELRIVGGAWRSRKLRVPAGPRLRPTPDRVRETLFNWLGPWIEGRRVLDLFAGSGALGLEALSRGAAEAVFIERSREAIAALRENAASLEAGARATLVHGDAMRFLERGGQCFDLVFVDPPYTSALAHAALWKMAEMGTLCPGGRIYLERGAGEPGEDAGAYPGDWEEDRATSAGEVRASLLRPAQPGVQSGDGNP